MSYSILYNQQFIKSKTGITPVVLMGDNNVWEAGRGPRDRRSREWGLLFGLMGASENEITKAIQDCAERSTGEIFVYKGKWYDKESFIRWGKRNISKASSIDSILNVNKVPCVVCMLTNNKNAMELLSTIETTEQLDSWIIKARQKIAKDTSKSLYPRMSFPREDLIRPNYSDKKHPDTVIVTCSRRL